MVDEATKTLIKNSLISGICLAVVLMAAKKVFKISL